MKQIKKGISLLLVLTMLVAIIAVGVVSTSAAESRLLGDADGNGIINVGDATYIQMAIARMEIQGKQVLYNEMDPNSIEFKAADVDKNGIVNVGDATLIQMFAAHMEKAQGYGIGEPIDMPQPPTEPTSEQPTSEQPTTEPLGSDYFLVGSFSNWEVKPEFNFAHSANEDGVQEYVITVQLAAGDEFKAVKGDKEAWYPDGEGNNCKAEIAGEYTVYLRPNGDGHDDWIKDQSGKPVLYVVAPSAPVTEEPTSEQPTSVEPTSEQPTSEQPTSEQPTSEQPTTEPVGSDYFLIGSFSEWEVLPQYNFAHSANEDGVQEYVITVSLTAGDTFKAVKGNKEAWYPDGMGNDCKAEVTGEYTIYLRPNGDGHDDWIKDQAGKPVLYIVAPAAPVTEEPTGEPTSEEPTSEQPTSEQPTSETPTSSGEITDGYYLIGKIGGVENWTTVSADNKLSEHDNTPGEYIIDKTFADGDEIKVVKVENGEIKTWYNDGGDNYKLTAEGGKTGLCRVYFRPEGNAEWSYYWFTVQPKGTPSSEEPTTETPTSSGEITDGYYLIGVIGGVTNWGTVSADNKLSEHENTPGEYIIDKTFADGDEIKVVKVENGEIKTWYNDGGDNYKLTAEGGKTGLCRVYFRPEGNAEWSYYWFTVQPKGTPSSEEPTSETPTSSGEITDGYYLIGKIGGVENWTTVSADNKLSEHDNTPGEYIIDKTFADGDEIKVVKVENGAIKTWYNDGGDNYKLTAEGGKTGLCRVYFRPEGNSEWSYYWFTVQPKGTPSSEEPTTETPTSSGEITDGYYLMGIIGGVKNWSTPLAENKLTANPAADGEYTIEKNFKDGDAIKVVEVKNGEIKTWYKDGEGNEYKLTAEGGKTGDCVVYFRPAGNPDWSYNYLTVQPKGTPSSEEPTSETPTSSGEITDGYYLMGIIGGVKNWSTPLAENKLTANPKTEGEYTIEKNFKDGDAIKVVEVKNGEIKTWYKDGEGNEYKLTAEGGKTGDCVVYFRPAGNPDWSYTYLTVQPKGTPSSEEPTSETPTSSGEITDGYYLMGIIGGVKNWSTPLAENKLTANPEAEGEYTIEKNFKDGDAIKVVEVKNGEIKTWYKDGEGNEYKLTAEGGKTGDCVVYFRPAGNPDWSYNYLTVQPKTAPSSETPASETPSSSTEIEDGYYLMGIIGGVKNWSEPLAENKLTANPAAEGEYTIEKNFKDGDAIKVVEVKNGEIKTWYKDGEGNEYKLTAEGGKTGDCTVYFRPAGNPDWSYNYLTVQPKTTPSSETPASETPSSSTEIEDGYYLMGIIGGVKNWSTPLAENKLTANPEAEGEYTIEKNFKDGDAIKVVEVKNGEIKTWYKDGEGNEYKLTAEGGKTGDCVVYFRPAGNPDWSYNYLTVQPKTAPSSETPASETPSSSTEIEDGYYLMGIIGGVKNWSTPLAENKLTANPEAEGEYTIEKNFKDGDAIKVVEVKNGEIKTWYKDGEGNEYKLTAEGGKTGDCVVYFRPAGNPDWSYNYLTVQPKTAPSSETPASETPSSSTEIEDGYYLMGIFGGETNWSTPKAANKLAANPAAEGEYTIEKNFKDGDAIKVVEVKNGEIKTWYKDGEGNEYKLTAEGGKTGDCVVYFRPAGNPDWSYNYLTVQPKTAPSSETPTTAPSTEAPATVAPTTSDIEDGYYLMGIFGGETNWSTPKAANKLAANPAAEGEYTIEKNFKDGDAIKVVEVKDGAIKTWYKDGEGNEYKLTAEGGKTGDCVVYFRPAGNPDWSYNYLTVQPKAVPSSETPTTAPSTEAPATVAPTTSDIEDGYYLMGIFGGETNWSTPKAANKLAANPAAEGEYTIEKTFADGDAIKVVEVKNGEIKTWYKDGEGNEYKLTAEGGKTGDCVVYFRPAGNPDWSYNYLTVQPKAVPSSETPTTAPSTEAPATVAPTTSDIEDGYYLMGIIGGVKNWSTPLAENKLTANPEAEGEYTIEKNFKDGDAIKVVEVKNGEIKTWYKDGEGNEYKLTAEGGKTGDCTVYFRPAGNPDWSYNYLTVQPKTAPSSETPTTAPSTEAPATVAPTTSDIEDGYYLMGIFGGETNWSTPKAANKLAANPAAEGEYTIEKNFKDGDAIKVVEVKNGEIKTWYKDGEGNEYKLTAEGGKTGDCVVYFRPAGNPDWSYNYLTVQPKAVPSSETPTTAPSTEAPATVAPTTSDIEDGYYLMGIFGGETNWSTPKAANKLAANPAAEGEYTIEKTFADGDAIKVVEVKNGEIKTWYKDGEGNEYKLTAEGGKTGDCTVYFRPAGNPDWSYNYLTVQPKTAPSSETPASEAPTTAPTTAPTEVIGTREYTYTYTITAEDKVDSLECYLHFDKNVFTVKSVTYNAGTDAGTYVTNPKLDPDSDENIGYGNPVNEETGAEMDTIKFNWTGGQKAYSYKNGVEIVKAVFVGPVSATVPTPSMFVRILGNVGLYGNTTNVAYDYVATFDGKEVASGHKDKGPREEEPSTDPTEPSENPSTGIDDGYYLIGKINGVTNWETVSADNKLAANPGVDGEYTIDKTFKDGDAIKVVEVKNGAIKTWYKDGEGNEYKLTAAGGKTGLCSVFFRPAGNPDWSYNYFTVVSKENASETPSETPASNTLMLKPNSDWLSANAWFAAYFFEDGKDDKWVKMTADSTGTEYTVEALSGYSNVIFVRMSKDATEMNWNNKWNQTDNLKVADGLASSYYKITGWDKSGEWVK